jgi:hypothetical protein
MQIKRENGLHISTTRQGGRRRCGCGRAPHPDPRAH